MAPSPLILTPLGFPWQPADPFLFCVHHDDAYPKGNEKLGPAAALGGRDMGEDFSRKDGFSMYHGRVVPGFPAHPHRGFETVTIVRKGYVDHSDSLGATARFGMGDVQWLTAGGGVVHAEMFPLLSRDHENPLELFQIWLNLPAADKMAPAHFTMFWGEQIPRAVIESEGGAKTEITIVAGAIDGHVPLTPPPHSWASRKESDLAIWCIRMDKGAKWTIPAAASAETKRTLFFFAGSRLLVDGQYVPAKHSISFVGDRSLTLSAPDDDCELLLLGGRPIGEPVVQYGPFVMNSRQQIQQAMMDYQRTRFGGWPWKSDDPVHAREETRFAKHVDGRVERP